MLFLVKDIKNKFEGLPLPVKVSVIYLICNLLRKGVAFFAVPVYTRMVSTEQYGIYTLYQSWESILVIFATLNMWNYLYNNGMVKFEGRKDDFASALTGLGLVVTCIVGIICFSFSNLLYKSSGLSSLLLVLMFVEFIFRPAYEYWSARQRFDYDVKWYAISAISITLLTPVVSILVTYLIGQQNPEYTGNALVVCKIACALLFSIPVFILIICKSRKLYDKEIWKFALGFNLPLIPHFLSTVILQQSDRIMIGNMCGTSEAAIYGVSYSVATVLLIVNTAVMDTIIPWTYKALKNKKYDKLPYVSFISLAAIVILNLMVAICAPEIITIMAPEEYNAAIYIIPPVAISNVFIFMYNLYANIEYYFEETRMVAIASCASAVANVVLNYIFIRKYGFVAAGYTTMVCYILYALFHFAFMRYTLKKNGVTERLYNYKGIWMLGFAASFLSIVVIFIYPYKWVRIGMILFILLIFLIYRKKIMDVVMTLKKKEF